MRRLEQVTGSGMASPLQRNSGRWPGVHELGSGRALHPHKKGQVLS